MSFSVNTSVISIFTPTPVDLTPLIACLCTVGGARIPIHIGPAQLLDSKPGPSLCEATMLTTVPPCCLWQTLVHCNNSPRLNLQCINVDSQERMRGGPEAKFSPSWNSGGISLKDDIAQSKFI